MTPDTILLNNQNSQPMKRHLLPLLIAAAASLTASATYSETYYSAMDGKSREQLKNAAKQCVAAHTTLQYTPLPDNWVYTDTYPDLYDGCRRWWEMYSNNIYLIRPGQSGVQAFSANRMQREHSVPKSWWKVGNDVEYTPAYTDLWNLYPSDPTANLAKSNYAFGPCESTTFDNGSSKVGPARAGYGGGSGLVFEPADEYKGDFARTIFYMATVYDELHWKYTWMFENNSWPSLRPWAYHMLLDWARRDPVSQKEIDRNNAVENQQGNRNPFIDFPELAEYIWGIRTSETFYIKDQGGTTTKPITGDPEITMPINGENIDFQQTVVGMASTRPLEIEGGNLTSALTVRVAGKDRAMFKVSQTSISAADINSGNRYLLDVTYLPTETGQHTANLMLYDGGLPIEGRITVTLRGEAFETPTLSRLTSYPPANVTETSYTASWSESPEVVDYYVVTRVRYLEDSQEAETYTSDVTYIEFTDRDPSVAESYYVQGSRLGFLSEPSETQLLMPGGVTSAHDSAPLAVGAVEGGFAVLLGQTQTNLRVYDMAGVLVRVIPEVSGGEIILLPQGVYLVTADGNSRPVKIVVL